MSVHESAGKPAPWECLEDIPALVAAYYTNKPDISEAGHMISFGTSGHRGSSNKNNFNESHILAICQAICNIRKGMKIDGPLFVGKDTHALSEPAFRTAVEVFAANDVYIRIQDGFGFTPTPVISHAILTHNRLLKSGQSDGVVITPSHNPPEDGGFKYNPSHGGPADSDLTSKIENALKIFSTL